MVSVVTIRTRKGWRFLSFQVQKDGLEEAGEMTDLSLGSPREIHSVKENRNEQIPALHSAL